MNAYDLPPASVTERIKHGARVPYSTPLGAQHALGVAHRKAAEGTLTRVEATYVAWCALTTSVGGHGRAARIRESVDSLLAYDLA